MTTEGRDDSTPIGVYGKVASQPDFLRSNAGEFSQCGLDRLLQDEDTQALIARTARICVGACWTASSTARSSRLIRSVTCSTSWR